MVTRRNQTDRPEGIWHCTPERRTVAHDQGTVPAPGDLPDERSRSNASL